MNDAALNAASFEQILRMSFRQERLASKGH